MPYDRSKRPQDLPASDITPATVAFAITPSDTVDLTKYAKSLRINAGGTLKFLPVLNDDSAPLTWDVQAGDIIPIQTRRVWATGTTATGITGLSD